MRILRAAPEIILWLLIVGVALLNVGLYTGVVQGEDAVDIRVAEGESDAPNTAAERALEAEHDDRADLPGTFVANQGRRHTNGYSEEHAVPFCQPNQVANSCYSSNPPTSGLHLGVERDVMLPSGDVINIPPDPGIYDFEIPRESIPHIQEHAGVYVGYNCESSSCEEAVESLTNLARQLITGGDRVVLAPSSDLPGDTIGLAAWTRVDTFPASEYEDLRVSDFIDAHSCRFDPEGFCN